MADNVIINVQQDNDIVNIVSSQVTEVIDINVAETTEEVTLNITEEIIQVNINKITNSTSTPSLQDITDVGNHTTNDIFVENNEYYSIIEPYDVGTANNTTGTYTYIGADGIVGIKTNNAEGVIKTTNLSNGLTLEFPDKVGSKIIATTEDIPTNTSDLTNDSNFVVDASYIHTDNNFTTTLKTKLDGIATGAEVNVNADWNATSGDAQILNKPTIPAAQIQSDWNQTNNTSLDYIKNKPSLTGFGDMLKSTYDTDNTGIVDNAEAIKIIGRNSTGTTLRRGTIIYISGSTGNRPNFVKAQANGESTSAGTFGVIADDLANNTDGYALALGYLDNLDTRSNATYPFTSDTLSDGDTIYLSPSTAGYITNVKPSAPNHLVYLGKVTRTSPTNGTIVYRVQNGYELEELHNVAISSVADKQLLSYDSVTSLWKNKSVTTADIADSTNKRYVTDANLTIIGNQSGTNTGDETTATIKTKLGAATTSTDGYLTSANWNTFNSKQASLGFTPFKYINTTLSTLTGTLTETIMATATIAGGTFSSNDIMKILFRFTRTSGTSSVNARIKINTSNTLTGAVLIGTLNSVLTSTYNLVTRTYDLSGGNLYGLNFAASAATDVLSQVATYTNTPFNTANTLYVFITLQLLTTSDSATFTMANITN